MKTGRKITLGMKLLIAGIFTILLAIIEFELTCKDFNSILGAESHNLNANVLSKEELDLINVSAQSAITTIDVTGMVEQDNAEHDCNNYLATAYNSQEHFKYCTVCGKDSNGNYITVKDREPHSMTDHWYLGEPSCHYANYNIRNCEKCGYGYRTTQPHEEAPTWYIVGGGRNLHYKICAKCRTWTRSEFCTDSEGRRLSCMNEGTCQTCGNVISRNSHYIYGNGVCRDCGERFFTVTDPVIKYSQDRSIAYVSFSITADKTKGAYLTGGMNAWTSTPNASAVSWSYETVRENDYIQEVSYVGTYTFDSKKQQKSLCYMGDSLNIVRVNGSTCYFSTTYDKTWTIWQDNQAPTSSITQKDLKTSEGWATLKQLTIAGTENLSDVVTISLELDGKKIYTGTTNVVNGNYSLSITPELEANASGRVLIYTVSDRLGNSIRKGENISKVDSKAPELTAISAISTEWAKSKDLKILTTDSGSGSVKIAFNNVNNYVETVQSGDSYAKTFRLIGDVYGSGTASIYIKDTLGNVRTTKVTISNLDNTAPTITKVDVSGDKSKITVTANDKNTILDKEGSGVKGYYYVFDNNIDNDFDISNAKYTTSNVIKNETEVANYSYIHIKAVDVAGNVSSCKTELVRFALNTTVNLDAADGKGGVDLEWGDLGSNVIYKAYQQKENSSEWTPISTVDFRKQMEPIKVLNVYPHLRSDIQTVIFKYKDGTSATLPKSAALKVWMEGGSINENGTITSFEAYGKNPYTGQQLLYVTPVNSTDFNNNPNIIWNYDIVMFGTWDTNGAYEDQLTDNAVSVVEKYIQSGYGVLAGHDTIGYNWNTRGLSKIRKYFNIETGKWASDYLTAEGVDYKDSWGYGSTQVKVEKQGLLTNFPWELPTGSILTVPYTHSCANAAKGETWMNFVNGNFFSGANTDPNKNYFSYGSGNAYYYLTTYNNTAMIQTGHSNCASTEDERKVLANTLFYLRQLTSENSVTDNSAQDLAAPEAPKLKLNSSQNNYVSLYSNDNGSKYSFYVEAYSKSDYTKVISKTNTCTEIVTTGTKGYYYVIDDNKTNNFDVSKATYTEDNRVYLNSEHTGKYLHVKAVDVAGNIGDVSDIYISFEEAGNLIKTASWVDANNAIAEITLNAKFADDASGVTSNKPMDMIILQDNSMSESKIETSKELLKNLANKVYDTVPDARIALVQFGSGAEVKYNLQNSSGRANLINIISSLEKSETSSYTAGLQKAIDIINSSSNASEKEICIVFVTEGSPNQNGKGLEEAKILKKNYNAKIYGIGINVAAGRKTDNIKNLCDSANYLNVSNADYISVYNKIFRNVVSYTNREIVCTDSISQYFNIVSVQNPANNVSVNGSTITWNIGEIRVGEATLKIKAQLKDEYRFFDRDVIAKYATNSQAILKYNENEVIWGSSKNHSRSAAAPALNYVYTPERITVKISGNKDYHGTEYFGLFTDTTSTTAKIYQSITYSKENSTTFSVVPGTYYLYMVDSNGHKLSDSNIWYYEVESTEGYIEEVTDGFKISNVMTSTISQTQNNKPSNVYNDILTVKNTHNKLNLKRIWLTIAGNVSLDTGKDGSIKNDVGMKNITVILHTINSAGKEELKETKTDEKGSYLFKDQEIAYKHYVEFKYNGQYYQPTIYKAEGVSWENSSKAVENITDRKGFNSKFETISSKTGTYLRDQLKAENIIDQYGNLISNGSSEKENYVKNCIISAYTGYNQNDNLYKDLYVYKNMKSDLGYKNYDFTKYINLGLQNRQQVDIAISQDIFSVKTSINNRDQNYSYNKRESYKTSNIYDTNIRVQRDYYTNNYTREIYKTDYNYTGENPLEVYVTYQLAIKNQSDEIAVIAKEIANFYDEDYEFIDIYLGYKNGTKVNVGVNLFEVSSSSKYGQTYQVAGYKTLYIRNEENNIKITAGGECYIYLTFKVNKESDKLKIENAKASFTELSAYSTYYYEDTAPNKNNSKTQKEYNPGDVAGIVDRDSTPGSLKLTEMTKLNKTVMLSGKNVDEITNSYGVQDDTDIAPSLKLTYEVNGKILDRSVTGTVWEEARDTAKYYAQIGNGTLDESEAKVVGVIVQLVNKANGSVAVETQTNENGDYVLTGFIPDEYYVRFIYGTNGGKYNGQDYKSTVYLPEVVENFNVENPDAYDKYNLKKADETQLRQSDARDLYGNKTTKGTRQYVNDYSNNQGNGVTNVLATTLKEMSSAEFKDNTYMTAKSAVLDIQIEYDRTSSSTSATGANNVGSGNYELSSYYNLANLDFGLVQRPKSQLELTVELANVKVTLSNNQVLFDASGRATNVMWISKNKNTDYYSGNLMKIPPARTNGNGQILLTMDKELMHGATIQLTYKFDATNIGEVDYKDAKFYYIGQEDKPYIEGRTKAADTNIVTATANTIISYVGSQMTDDGNATRNNLQFINLSNEDWETISMEEILREKLLDSSLIPQAREYSTIIKTDKLGEKKLIPILVSEEEGRTQTDVIFVETITPETSVDDRTYNCMSEIIKTSNDVGRRMEYTTVGNQDPTRAVAEIDTDAGETVTILPPFGQKQRYEYFIVGGIVLAILGIGITGIIIFMKRK